MYRLSAPCASADACHRRVVLALVDRTDTEQRVFICAGYLRAYLRRLFERPHLDHAVSDRARSLRDDLYGLSEGGSIDQGEAGYR
jgi:hypothetical protein